MNSKACLAIFNASFIQATSYRVHLIFTAVCNFTYMIMIYYLWNAIFEGANKDIINGMTFTQTYIYLAVAGTFSTTLFTWTESRIARNVKSGNIIMDFIRPIDYQIYLLSCTAGDLAMNFLIVFLPSIIITKIIAGHDFKVGFNLIFFILSIILAIIINQILDFIVGLLAFYTESIWGISTMKDIVVRLLSGAMIPMAYFPEYIEKIIIWFPFQAIYHLPLSILIESKSIIEYFRIILIQFNWIIIMLIISRLLYQRARRVVIVNGG